MVAVNIALIPIFVALGGLVGFLAGLLGIGGGMTIVPVLAVLFSREGFEAVHVLPLAIGTACATIVSLDILGPPITRRAVDWLIVRHGPGACVGLIIGHRSRRLAAARAGGDLRCLKWFTVARMLRNTLKAERQAAGAR